MNAERFCEILTEEGYPIEAIKCLWDGLLRHDIEEAKLRESARFLKEHKWLDGWKIGYESRTGIKL